MAKMGLPILFVLCLLVLSSAIPIGKDENAMVYLQKYSYFEESTGYRVGPHSISEKSVVGTLKVSERFAGFNETEINMLQVYVHVFGHPLGSAHSDDKDSAKTPYYTSYQPSFNLGEDHGPVMQALYGAYSSSKLEREEAESSPEANDAPDICKDAVIDTVTRTKNGSTYVFKGDFYWEVLSYKFADGYPRKISEDWDGLVGNLDASFTWADGKTLFFKEGKYWMFTNKRMDPGYPKLIRFGFDGIPDAVDAALVWSGNGKTYFFKGDQYWRYDSHADLPVSEEFPRPITDWEGLPNNIDAAFQWEGNKTYLFKGNKYYRFDGVNFAVETQDPPYPRPTSPWWFGC